MSQSCRTTITSSRTILSIPTTISLQAFADRVLVLITQVGKVGNLIQVTAPSTGTLLSSSSHVEDQNDSPPPGSSPQDDPPFHFPVPPPTITLMPLLGRAPTSEQQTLHELYAAQAATLIWVASEGPLGGVDGIVGRSFDAGTGRKPVVVGVALRKEARAGWDIERERRMFRSVMLFMVDMLIGRGEESR